jgi:predicted amidohydrolase
MSGQKTLRVAAAQYGIGSFKDWADYAATAEAWVGQAAREGATLLVFPEYFSLELVSLFAPAVQADLTRQLEAIQELYSAFLALYGGLAQRHDLYIQAGTFPAKEGSEYRNRAWLFAPDGSRDYQDKLMMTRFENEQWGISPGRDIKTLKTDFGALGISICYDVEFPLIARRQVELGARLILAPSCCDTMAGYWRVRIGCQARALENQCYVVQAPTVGEAPWSAAVDRNVGAAAIYTPVDYGFPEDGVLAIGSLNEPAWVFADLDLANIEKVREAGQVFNHRDWPKQQGFISDPS